MEPRDGGTGNVRARNWKVTLPPRLTGPVPHVRPPSRRGPPGPPAGERTLGTLTARLWGGDSQLVGDAIPRRCVAGYFPEGNVLVRIGHVAALSNEPADKSVKASLERAGAET